jgi:hypothetical protein
MKRMATLYRPARSPLDTSILERVKQHQEQRRLAMFRQSEKLKERQLR